MSPRHDRVRAAGLHGQRRGFTPRVETWAVISVAALSLLGRPGTVAAQAAAGGILQSYTFDDPANAGLARIRLMTLPFAISIPLGDRVAVQAGGAFAEGRVTGADGAEGVLSGLTDTEVGIALALGPDRVVVTAGASLPTGQSTQTLGESVVAGVVAAELLPFTIASWGSGGGAGGDVAVAFQSGAWGIGLSGGYRAASEFEPLADQTFSYRPGNQLRFRMALDRDVAESGTFSLVVGAQRFSEDQLGGSNLFRSGNRLEGIVSYAFAVGLRSSALLYGGAYHRANGSLLLDDSALDGATGSPSQQLFTGGLDVRVPLGRRAVLLPDVAVRVFRSEDGVGQGWIGSAGATVDLTVAGRGSGRRFALAPSARYRIGHVIVSEGAESGLSGWEAGVTLRVEAGR